MINVTKSFLPPYEEFIDIFKKSWDSGWLTNRGELVKDLEKRLCDYLDVNGLLAMSNGTLPLQIAIKALDLKGEIITTPFSYVATTSAIKWQGCIPVFVDISPDCLTIDPTKIEAAINKNTCAILATHVYGNPCDVIAIKEIADRYSLPVIYDAAHCFGVKYNGESLFNYGTISTCSFHATKVFQTGEGGCTITQDETLYKKIYSLHNFGHKNNTEFQGEGINAKMNELQAALGLSVLPYMDDVILKRKAISDHYDHLLTSAIKKLTYRENTIRNYSYYPVLFDSEEVLLKVSAGLSDHNINARRYFFPSLDELPYVELADVPISRDISKRILCLPLYPDLDLIDVERICGIVNSALV
ncbi:aminotransferase DegT [Dokdonia pacifica]|uniref:dTDP-4-amino-4,6-dideoxygalactose transaminase n=1 Tax=Dokdonia pacifica TaxID=1627892 RepID=A0A239BSG5_9FLAO|nr:DegT/DnrJ/EryC1/StrS family aminotransferase [Dokdonia pacifica]GGG28143.1 aminotransferase DegT [Dokdonia pacifica]SNS09994.1 dTDP-4-amino-4,6-dideoxygalactose transaminase [Dokdonia pacifica]